MFWVDLPEKDCVVTAMKGLKSILVEMYIKKSRLSLLTLMPINNQIWLLGVIKKLFIVDKNKHLISGLAYIYPLLIQHNKLSNNINFYNKFKYYYIYITKTTTARPYVKGKQL